MPRVKMIGDTALVRVRSLEMEGLEDLALEVQLRYPKARSILAYSGVQGPYRLPETKLIGGQKPSLVVHKEYDVEFELDPARAMFCLGNSFERLRLAVMVRSWEVVVDMFAGVGQFSLPIAIHASPIKVHAIEINQETYSFLTRNIEKNDVREIVEPHLGDCRKVSEELRGVADRVIMGYFGGTLDFLSAALDLLCRAGGIIHIHELVRRGELSKMERDVIKRAEQYGYDAEILHERSVKSYSPSKEHIVIDLFAIKK